MLIKISDLYPYYKERRANTIAHTIEYTFGSEVIMKYHLGDMSRQKIKFFELDDVIEKMKKMLNEPEIHLPRSVRYLEDWNELLDELIEINEILKEKEDEQERLY